MMRTAPKMLLALCAVLCTHCAPGALHMDAHDVLDGDDTDTAPEDSETSDTIEDVVGSGEDDDAEGCSDIYDQDILPTFHLDFEPDEWNSIVSACYAGSQAYHPVRFSYEEETVEAMVRLKGNWSWSCDKMQFVISFNEEDSDGRFHGSLLR